MSKTVGKVVMALLAVSLLAAIPLVGACAKEAPAPATAPAPAAPEVFKWRIQNYHPAAVPHGAIFGADLCDLIRGMSNGRLDITPFAAGELVKTTEIMEAVGKEVVEMGTGCGSYWAGKIPVATMEYGLPYSFGHKAEMDSFMYKKGFIEILRGAYAKYGCYYVGYAADNGFSLLSKEPVNTVADLKKMKLRASGAGADLLKELEASMVALSGPELYTALATGVIEGCVYGGFQTQWNLGNHEVTNYVMWPKIMPVHGPNLLIVNTDKWNSLPDDLKAIVDTAWRLQAERFFLHKYNGDVEYLGKMKEYGLEVVTLPEAEQTKMRKAAAVVWDDVASRSENCAKAVELMKDYLKFLGY